METKLITKTIKELADEYDGNVEQLHREIRRYNQVYDYQKREIEELRCDARILQQKIEREEKVSESSIIIMFACVVVLFAWIAINILIG